MKHLVYLLLLLVRVGSTTLAYSQPAAPPFATWTDAALTLTNGVVQRTIKLPTAEGNFLTSSDKPVSGEFRFFQKWNDDFEFEANGVVYSGKSNWMLAGITRLTDERKGDGAAVVLLSADKNWN